MIRKKDSPINTLLLIMAVAVFYAVTGYLGLYLATPPGYATAVWIPSGIALGAALVWGLRTIPGVFLGSFVTNYFITQNMEQFQSLMPILVGIALATGAVLQAIVGWWLIKKNIGLKNSLLYPKDIFKFAILSGPVSCLVNATLSNTALMLMNRLEPSAYLLSWVSWWVGDSMGVLLITPLFLILFAKPSFKWRPRIIPILLPLCLGFVTVVFTYLFVYYSEVKRIESQFATSVSRDLLQTASFDDAFEKNKENYYYIAVKDASSPNLQNSFEFSNSNISLSALRNLINFNQTLLINNKPFHVEAIASPDYFNKNFSSDIRLVLIAGLLFCILINTILFMVYGAKWVAQRETKNKIKELKSEEFLNLSILKAAGEGVFGLNKDAKVTFINPMAAAMLGYKENELIGRAIYQLIMPNEHSKPAQGFEVFPVYETLRFGQIKKGNEIFFRSDNSKFWVSYTSTPLKEKNEITGAVVVFNDITSQRKIEMEMYRMAHFDMLTGLPNRRSFVAHIAKALTNAQKKK